MKKLLFSFAIAALMLVSACVGNLDSINKRFAAFEIAYKSALVELEFLNTNNQLTQVEKVTIVDLLEEVNRVRAAAYIAKNAGAMVEAQDKLTLAITALDALKEYLVKAGAS